jgi:uncharacterized membrane protein YccC
LTWVKIAAGSRERLPAFPAPQRCSDKAAEGGRNLNLHRLISGAQLALRAALGATVSYGLASVLGLQHPMYALIAAVIVTDFLPSETTKLGFQRLVATAIGAACGAILRVALGPGLTNVGLGIFISMLACHMTPARPGAKLAGYLAALVLLDHGENPWTYGLFRFIETVLGVAVAWTLSLVPRLIKVEEPNAHKSAPGR